MSQNALALSQLSCGEKGKVVSVDAGSPYYRQKLLCLGLVPGVSFQIVRVAPLGCPIEVLVRGCSLSLRKQEIDILQVEKLALTIPV
ncbi:MAG: ferrous iron transport protein A [Legionellales bacterium]|nr:ferrous iron transport protein A [Legionellales bacterium]|tara:strand:- start:1190 stop:1450 length:261 start_codon:yes stop_codon:yes gene_type:complete